MYNIALTSSPRQNCIFPCYLSSGCKICSVITATLLQTKGFEIPTYEKNYKFLYSKQTDRQWRI